MSLDAVALLRLTLDQLAETLRLEEETSDTTVFRAMGRSLEARALEDATTLHLALRFDTPESTLGSVLRRDLGDLIEAHGDPRGVFVYPSVAQVEATTYEGALEELGEGGMWVSVPAAKDARVGPADAMGVFQGLAAGLGPDMFRQVEQMLGGAGGDDDDDLEAGGLAEFAQGLLANPEMRGMIEGLAGQLFGGQGGQGGQADPGDLMGRAREMAAKAVENDPGLLAKAEAMKGSLDPQQLAGIAGAMGLVQPPGDADEEEDERGDATHDAANDDDDVVTPRKR